MKVTTAYKENDLSILSSISEPIAIYTNDKKIHENIVKIRKDYVTHLIYHNIIKSPHQVIVDYQDLFYENGASDLEVYYLPTRYEYIPYVFLLIVVILLILFIVSLAVLRNNKIKQLNS